MQALIVLSLFKDSIWLLTTCDSMFRLLNWKTRSFTLLWDHIPYSSQGEQFIILCTFKLGAFCNFISSVINILRVTSMSSLFTTFKATVKWLFSNGILQNLQLCVIFLSCKSDPFFVLSNVNLPTTNWYRYKYSYRYRFYLYLSYLYMHISVLSPFFSVSFSLEYKLFPLWIVITSSKRA